MMVSVVTTTQDAPALNPRHVAMNGDVAHCLDDLEDSHVLTPRQARRLRASWPTLDDEVWSDPYLRAVPEHTRMHIASTRTSGSPI